MALSPSLYLPRSSRIAALPGQRPARANSAHTVDLSAHMLIPLCYAVILERGGHALPAVVGGFVAVARPVVGIEAVRHAFIDVDLRLLVLARRLERGAHLLNRLGRNTLVGAAVEP